jgi:ubiquinone/menaquinone biosynthesis C-methylase UbiE
VQDSFRKDLSHLAWTEVYARQEKRAHLVPAWMDALQLKPGDHVLEIGAGPGFVTLMLAGRVGRDGLVYAIDISAEALDHLKRLQEERGLAQIRRIVADATMLAPAEVDASSALVSMVLHHVADPAAMLRNLARLLPPGGLALVAEFHPDAPADHGPPPEHRIDPDRIRQWSEQAGFAVLEYHRQTDAHYMMLLQHRA